MHASGLDGNSARALRVAVVTRSSQFNIQKLSDFLRGPSDPCIMKFFIMKNTTLWIIIGLVLLGGVIAYTLLPSEAQPADLTTRARAYCDGQNVVAVHISRSEGIIRVTSSLLGGGATYHGNGDESLQCPVVDPDSMSMECRAMMEIADWERVCGEEEDMLPSHEEAEMTAFNFILDFIAIAPPESDAAAADRIMAALSANALEQIDRENVSRDVAQFIGVQDAPDQGASVEDLQIVSDTEAYLVVGLNYSGGRTERNVHLVAEDGMWKVDRVSIPEGTNENASSPSL